MNLVDIHLCNSSGIYCKADFFRHHSKKRPGLKKDYLLETIRSVLMNEFFYHDNADPNQKSREAGFLNERSRECAYS